MYDHNKQYKHDIIRARAISDVDNLLPKYASIIDKICPCSKEDFTKRFNEALESYVKKKVRNPDDLKARKKTLDNHRTEITGALFGMYYESEGQVYASERTIKFLQDNDQPAFFKDWLLKMQFPNGAQTSPKYSRHISAGISCHPYSVLLKVLELFDRDGIQITKQEIGYYILNSEDVLKGHASPYEVYDAIIEDKKTFQDVRRITIPEGESSAYDQHIGDQLQYLQLANLIILNGKYVSINKKEKVAISAFVELINQPLGFDVNKYDITTLEGRKQFESEWSFYYGKLSSQNDKLATPLDALISDCEEAAERNTTSEQETKGESTVELGDEGERYVYQLEKNRVANFNARLVGKVIALGKTKGLGYDIQSVIAEPGDEAEFVKYIEVKSTKRVTVPDLTLEDFNDTLNITRNEWIAAQQHKEYYSIYRVYFSRDGVTIFVIVNPYQKSRDGEIQVVPMTYRVDFTNKSIDAVIKPNAS